MTFHNKPPYGINVTLWYEKDIPITKIAETETPTVTPTLATVIVHSYKFTSKITSKGPQEPP